MAIISRGLVGLFVAGMGTVACSLALDTSGAQCRSDGECASRGFAGARCVDEVCVAGDAGADAAATQWACVGHVTWPSTGPAKVKLSLPVVDVLTGKAPVGVSARLCPKLDPSCSSPLTGQVGINATSGLLEATLDAGFDGYIELTSPSITPALFFVTRPVWQDTALVSVLPVVSKQGFEQIAGAIGATLDLTTKGHLFALASDCDAQPAAGVRFEVDKSNADTKAYYMIANVPVGNSSATDASGSGGFLNLSPGFAKTTGYVSATGARLGEAGFAVRAGAVSYVRVLPTP